MFLVAKDLLRMTAIRNALQLCALFIVIMVAASIYLRLEISDQIHDDIDDALSGRVQAILDGKTGQDGIPIWFLRQSESMFVGNSESYLSKSGKLIGPANRDIFGRVGFHTIPSSELFSDRYFEIVQNEFLPRELDGDDDDFDHDADILEDLVENELWRVYVRKSDAGVIAAYTPIHEVEDALELLPSILFPITALILIATLVGGLVLGIRQQKRISHIQDGLKQIAAGNLSHRLAPKDVRDDMDDLMLGIDDATLKLEASIRQLTDFSRNVAHELRTPLTQLRAVLETAQDPDDLARAITKTEDIIQIFDAIQRISRLGRPDDISNLETVSLNRVAEVMADLYSEVAEEQGQELVLTLGQDTMINGDWQLLAQLASNLVENALNHTSPGSTITIETHERALCISDTGPGIPIEDRSRVFEPFYKRDSARMEKGSGLGLALVRAIAEYHNAGISLSDGPNGGLMVKVEF